MVNIKHLDVVIFGASGFTGKRAISELSRIIKSENLTLTWGVAGRSEQKIKDTLLEIGHKSGEDYSNIPIIHADVNDIKSLEDMTANARVIINAVGPYHLYGEKVIQACIKTKTHQIDISSPIVESQYIQHIYAKYLNAARQNGVYIISACGLDAIPAELGTIFLQNQCEETLHSVKTCLYYTEEKHYPGAIINAATYQSLVHKYSNTKEFPLYKLFYRNTLKDLMTLNKLTNKWCFICTCDTFYTESQRQMCEIYNKKPILIESYIGFDNIFQIVLLLIAIILSVFLPKFLGITNFLLKHPKFFTFGSASIQGPSDEKQKNVNFHLLLVGTGCSASADEFATRSSNTVKVAQVVGRDYYRACGSMLAISAIITLTERDAMPISGGCYTPAAAFANTSMIKMLSRYGINFQLTSK